MKNGYSFASASLITLALGATPIVPGAAYADSLLTGAVTSAAGEKMGGVTVSAKAEGATITTSVFTDESGNYYFPALPNGKQAYVTSAFVKEALDKGRDLFKWEEKKALYSGKRQGSKARGIGVAVSPYAGGSIVGDDGKTPTVDSPEAAAGLGQLADAYADGNIPKAAITYTEEEGRIAFESGKLLFLRNWPYVYSLASTEDSSKVKGKFDVAPLPGTDGVGASSLGGHNLGISAYSDNKATAIDFVKYMESEESQKFNLTQGSLAPIVESLYTDEALVKQYGYLPVLLTSIQNAVPRPLTPFYPAVTKAIQDNAYAAMKGETSVEDSLKNMSDAIAAASSS